MSALYQNSDELLSKCSLEIGDKSELTEEETVIKYKNMMREYA